MGHGWEGGVVVDGVWLININYLSVITDRLLRKISRCETKRVIIQGN